MERDPQRVSAVLADPTRYQIYQHVLAAPAPVSVTETATAFRLHPNVARLHLGRLTEIGLLSVHRQKSGKGGRPGYRYGPSGSTVSLTVPARDFQLLADLLVQSLALTGDGGKDAIAQIGHTFGRRLGREALATVLQTEGSADRPVAYTEVLEACGAALERLGVTTHVLPGEDGMANLVLRTCGFQEVASAHPEHVCFLCKAMVEGVAGACLEADTTVVQSASRPRGDRECVYEVNGVIRLQ